MDLVNRIGHSAAHKLICQGYFEKLDFSPDQLKAIMTLDGQLENRDYSFQEILELISHKNILTYWEQLFPYFPVLIDRKGYYNDLNFLEEIYGISSQQLKIANTYELTFYNRLVTASKYGLMDTVRDVIEAHCSIILLQLDLGETRQVIPDYIPSVIMEALEESIKHAHLEIAKYLIYQLADFIPIKPELGEELIVVVCRNGCLPILQYCERQLEETFTEEIVEDVIYRKRRYFNLGFLGEVEQKDFIDYLDEEYDYPLASLISEANI